MKYREFTYDGDIHYSVMNIPGLEENNYDWFVIKRYSMCGARIGCIVSKKQRANGHQWNLHKRDWALQHLRK
jgi:aspartate aminotransferase